MTWKADVESAIVRRRGLSPQLIQISQTAQTCPDVFETANGDFLVIGTEVTMAYRDRLPKDAGCAEHEAIVAIPNGTMRAAAESIVGTKDDR